MTMENDRQMRRFGFSLRISSRSSRRLATSVMYPVVRGLFILLAGSAFSCESTIAVNTETPADPAPVRSVTDPFQGQKADDNARDLKPAVHISTGALYDRGKQALSRSEFGKAIELLREVAVTRPDDVELHYWLGVAYWNREQGEQAIQAYRRAISLDPDVDSEWSLFALENLAEVYTRTDHAREARDTYRQSLLLETREEWITKIHNQIAELDLGLGEFVPNRDAVYNERGEIIGGVGPGLMHTNRNFEIARQTNDPVKEEKYYRLAIETEPQMYQPYFNLGLALVHQGRFDDALRWLVASDEVWKRDSIANPRQTDKADAQAFLALCYVELGDLDRAVEHSRRALATGESNYWATLYSLRLKIERGQVDEVLSQLEQLAGANPEHSETLYTLSLAYETSGRLVDAKRMLRRAVDAIPENHPWMDRLRREWHRLLLDADVSQTP